MADYGVVVRSAKVYRSSGSGRGRSISFPLANEVIYIQKLIRPKVTNLDESRGPVTRTRDELTDTAAVAYTKLSFSANSIPGEKYQAATLRLHTGDTHLHI